MFGVSTTATQPPGGVNKQTGAPLFPTGKALRIPRFKYQPSVFDETVKSPENTVFAICQSIKTVTCEAKNHEFRLFTGPSVFNRSHFPFLTAICPDSRVARHLGPHTGFGRKWNNFDR
jgi:hypothetical protein